MNIEEIKKILETAKFNSVYDNFPLSKEEIAIDRLLSIIDTLELDLTYMKQHEELTGDVKIRFCVDRALKAIREG